MSLLGRPGTVQPQSPERSGQHWRVLLEVVVTALDESAAVTVAVGWGVSTRELRRTHVLMVTPTTASKGES